MKIITLIFSLISFYSYSQLTLDTTFANDGFLENTDMKAAEQIKTDSAERILCITKTSTNQDIIARFLPDGSLDTSFGDNGIAAIQYQGSALIKKSILITGADEILFFGKSVISGVAKLVVGKLNTNGTLDTSFGTDGYFNYVSTIQNVTPISIIEHEGKILIASYLKESDLYQTLMIKLNTNGSLDQTFGDNGLMFTQIYSYIDCSNIKVDDNDNIYISGHSPMFQYYISKYTSNGLLDPTFGYNGQSTGVVSSNMPENAKSYSLQVTQDKILVIGHYDALQVQPLIHYYRTVAVKFDLTTGNYLNNVDLVIGADRFDGGFASYQFEDGKLLLGGLLSFSESGGPRLTRFFKVNDNFDIDSSLSLDSESIQILSYAKQGSAILAAGKKSNNLFIMRINDGPLGLTDFEKNSTFTIYPNPSDSNFRIKSLEPIKTVTIYDELGKELKRYSGNDAYDVSNLSVGIYFVFIETGTKSEIKKLIIE